LFVFWALTIRHKDHFIEYTPAQFQEEVIDAVKSAGYLVESVNMFATEKFPVQPSFILFAKRDSEKTIKYVFSGFFRALFAYIYRPNQQFIDEINNMRNTLFTNVFLNRNQVKVDKKKLKAGKN
jgi:hypothetical protein